MLPEVETLYLFLDACTGQNRNNTVVQYLHSLTASWRFDHIQHIFPTHDRSYLASDSDFAQIELSKGKQDVVYTPHDWIEIIKQSHSNSVVTECEQNMFNKYNDFLEQQFKLFTKSQKTREKSRMTTYKMFRYRTGLPITVSKTSSGIVMHKFNLARQRRISILAAKESYRGSVPFKPAKLVDLKKMLDVIPVEKRSYFDDLIAADNPVPESTKQGDGDESGSEVWDSD